MQPTKDEKIANLKELLSRLVNNNEWQKALVIGEYLILLDPEDIQAYRSMGLSCLELHDFEESQKYFLKAMEWGDSDPATLMMIARIHSITGDLTTEISWLKKTMEQDPGNSKAAYCLACAYMKLGENEDAEVLLKEVISSHPDHIPSRNALMEIYLLAQDLDRAEEQLQEAIVIEPNNPQLLHDLGYILKRKENYPEALTMLFRALEWSPNKFEQYSEIGDAYVSMGDPDQALLYLRKANQLDPTNALVCYNLGRAYFDLGQYRQAEAASRAALQHDPEMVHGRSNIGLNANLYRGWAYLNGGHLQEAEQCFRKNLFLVASSYGNLGRALHRQGKFEEGRQNFLRAIDLVPNSAEYWDLLGNSYMELNRLDEAQAALEKSVGFDPEWSLPHYDLGVIFSRIKGRENEAMKLFKHAIELDKEGFLPYYAIACLYALQNKRWSALDNLRKSIQLGFDDRTYVDNDHDWDAFRKDEEFQKIMNGMDLAERFIAEIEADLNTPANKPEKKSRKNLKK